MELIETHLHKNGDGKQHPSMRERTKDVVGKTTRACSLPHVDSCELISYVMVFFSFLQCLPFPLTVHLLLSRLPSSPIHLLVLPAAVADLPLVPDTVFYANASDTRCHTCRAIMRKTTSRVWRALRQKTRLQALGRIFQPAYPTCHTSLVLEAILTFFKRRSRVYSGQLPCCAA
jgi:hypothetical protein